jgi:hypothetical protein
LTNAIVADGVGGRKRGDRESVRCEAHRRAGRKILVELFGRLVSKADLTRRVGQMSQIAGARASELSSGLAKGVDAVDVKTGTGFAFTVLPGRGLDIAWASYKGAPIGYISKSGVVGSAHFVEKGAEGFLRNFFAGLLTTAGLSNIGPPVQDGDESLGLHGRVSNIPAEDVCVSQDWQGDDYMIRVAGTVRQARTFGECLVLHREITTQLGANALVVRDVVENAGSRPEPMMLLYHCNFGYPIVSADSRIFTSGGGVEARDPTPAQAVADHDRLGEPQAGYVEQCFYHDLRATDGRAFAAIFNERLGVGGYVRYRVANLPQFVQWKMLGEQEYVVGLEPATHRLDRRAELIRQGRISPLAVGERRTFEVEIGVLDGRAALDKLASTA